MADKQVDFTAQTIDDLARALGRVINPSANASFGRSPAGTATADDQNQSTEALKEEMSLLREAIFELKKRETQAKKEGDDQAAQQAQESQQQYQNQIDTIRDSINTQEEKNDVLDQSVESHKEHIQSVRESKKEFIDFTQNLINSAGFVESTKQFTNDFKESLRTGLDLDYIDNMFLGMTQQEIMALKKEYRRLANVVRQEGGDFRETINTLQNDLYQFVGDEGIAADLAGSMMNTTRRIGLAGEDAEKFVKGTLVDTFKVMNSNLSVTASEFKNLTTSLLNNKEMQQIMLRSREDERSQIAQNVIALTKHFKTLGYTNEEAQQLSQQFASMQTDDPIDRIKEAARMRAMGGAMGMDARDTRRLQQLRMKGFDRLDEDEVTELRQLQADLGESVQRMKGRNLRSEMFASVMQGKFGLEGVSEAGVDNLMKLRQEGMEQEEVRQRTLPEKFGAQTLQYLDNIQAILKSSPVGMVTGGIGGLLKMGIDMGLHAMTAGAVISALKGGGIISGIASAFGFDMDDARGKAGRVAGTAGKVGRTALKGAPVVASGIAMYEGVTAEKEQGKEIAGAFGSIAGGAAAGAAAGAASLNPIGVAIGSVAGAILGEKTTEAIVDASHQTTQEELNQKEKQFKQQKEVLQKIGMSDDQIKNMTQPLKEAVKNLRVEQYAKEMDTLSEDLSSGSWGSGTGVTGHEALQRLKGAGFSEKDIIDNIEETANKAAKRQDIEKGSDEYYELIQTLTKMFNEERGKKEIKEENSPLYKRLMDNLQADTGRKEELREERRRINRREKKAANVKSSRFIGD